MSKHNPKEQNLIIFILLSDINRNCSNALASVTVSSGIKIKCFLKQKEVKSSAYNYLLSDSSGKITHTSKASNVLAYLKSLIDNASQSNHEINVAKINTAASLIQSVSGWRTDNEKKAALST